MVFLPPDDAARATIENIINEKISAEGHGHVLGWRDVPVDNSDLGYSIVPTEPVIKQIFIDNGKGGDRQVFERDLFVIRRLIELAVKAENLAEAKDFFYIPSMSSYTVLYKGLLLSSQLGPYYDDLRDPDTVSAMALVHQRFSTNTFPTWSLSQPFRMICHNGEINTVRGNVNWMAARHETLASDFIGRRP